MDIKISVILPSLNVSKYIAEALKSVCSQTMREMEIICVDAGSTDGTCEIIESEAQNDPRIRLKNSDVRSYGYQVNLGIREAKGKYIAVLETDDFIDLKMYERLYELAEENTADYVKADYDAFFTQNDGTYYYFPRHSFADKEMYDVVMCPRENSIIGRDDWYLWQGIYLREFLQKKGIRFNETPGAAYQDIGFLFWTGVLAERALYCKDILYHYRIDRDAASSNSGKGLRYSYEEFFRIVEELKKNNDKALHTDQVNRLLYTRMAKSFVSCYSRISEKKEDVDSRREIYDWFVKQLGNAAVHGWINEVLVQSGRWARLGALLDSEKSFFERFYSKDKDIPFFNQYESFVIFGCGDFGLKAYKKICSLDKKVVAFADNNTALWDKSLNNVRIYQPKELAGLSDDLGIVIANEAHYADIHKQLIEMGISADRLFVFQ